MTTWHILAGEYPPQHGGVSDYTEQLAHGLAEACAAVHVWCPKSYAATTAGASASEEPIGIKVHRLHDAFAPSRLTALGRALNKVNGHRTILVQYAPNAFGLRGMNVFFCGWLVWRGVIYGDDVRVMFHEPFYYFARRQRLRLNLLAFIQRLMAVLLLAAGRTAYVSTPAWEKLLRPFSLVRNVKFQWLPIPATIPFIQNPEASAAIRHEVLGSSAEPRTIVGHFGTYGELGTPALVQALLAILKARPSVVCLCLGQNAEVFAETFRRQHPEFSNRVVARGYLQRRELSSHLQACDLFVQPYVDGVTARRTSLMALLQNGLPVVSNLGQYSEPVWTTSTALALASRCDASEMAHLALPLVDDEVKRSSLADEAPGFYAQHFSRDRTISILLQQSVMTAVDENGLQVEAR